ncbi:MAG: type II secretion system secretin GspD [Myxococcales bacterium]|nr:type II secretion system secretin GspD [Myxococcales bacterium]
MSRVSSSVLLGALLASSSSLAEPREGCLELRKAARFTVYFERVELDKLVQTVSDATCKSFIVADGVKGRISIVGPENGRLMLDADQFYAAFLAALDANGLTAVPHGRFVRIVEKRTARQFPIPVLEGDDPIPSGSEVLTRIHRLVHVEVEATRVAVAAFLSQGGDMVAVPPDLLIVTDLGSNQQRIAHLLEQLDVQRPSVEVTRLVKVQHASADELLDKVTRALAPKAASKPQDALTALADDRTNRILLVGTAPIVGRAEKLIGELDLEVPGDSRARVVRLKNADAKDLASTLEAMTSGAAQRKAPGGAPADIRITINEALNALLIVSGASDYRALAEVIEQLDRPVRQVFIETVIMEVNLQRGSKFGISVHGTAGTEDVGAVFGSQPEGAPSSLSISSLAASTGLLFGLQGPVLSQVASLLGIKVPSFGVTVQASQGTSDVNVLSMPHLLTADNKEAEIAVGQKVPFQLGVNQSQLAAALASGNTNTANLTQLTGSISREKVELRLTVKPHIGDGGDIRLEINQQAEELAGTSSSAGPITSTRSQKTSVVAKNEETLVLGGIMQDRDIEEVSKVPFFGDIPLIGNLFRHTVKTRTKVNLLVFLTPHVIHGSADFKRLIARKMAERQRVLEQVSAARAEYDPTSVDVERRPGPLAAIARALAQEEKGVIEPR